jgi:hypothetical protein
MPYTNPTPFEKDLLQNFYVSSRALLAGGVVPAWGVQRSFEEAMSGYMGDEVWRPSHISRSAAHEIMCGSYKNVQRAHGVVGNRLDRYQRTVSILTGEEKAFDSWWSFWKEHDSTVLITRSEHGSNRRFTFEELIEIPREPHVFFVRAGFSFKVRKKVEIAWLKTVLNASTHLTSSGE